MNRITIDTNILVRLLADDDTHQQKTALEVLENADLVAIPTGVLMETVWVLAHSYKLPKAVILAMLRQLIMSVPSIRVRHDEVEAGFSLMEANGDFADGVHAHTGRMMGGNTFVTFDRQAASLLHKSGEDVFLLR